MEISLNDCTLSEALEEMKYHQSCGREAFFEGVGNGNVIIKVPSIFILNKLQEVKQNGRTTRTNKT